MGGHGGLNILPQKRWNVYNYENREKVRRDEEAAAREEQLKREQAHRRDSEFRLEKLRQAAGRSGSLSTPSSSLAPIATDSGHINLFEGLKDFYSLSDGTASATEDVVSSGRKNGKEAEDVGVCKSGKKRRKEDGAAVRVQPEDEKYKLGYGLIGKGVNAPWYASKRVIYSSEDVDHGNDVKGYPETKETICVKNSSGKKTIEQLREERIRREKQENERERSILGRKKEDRGFSRRKV
ncbi:hypothetical protein HPP92_014044 [Vanilla planifolia]|uniref:CBF1-interacting co-repressor CIR N-terminal domain-containing protein n=1 Tax=Vanilla planifolia TaxID=51239 RepID=A0A835QG49_VANPL|nr:hypothetical protein HPP92_014482 [Vanilla planifolia]KAG0474358.1 hypothetical protein HPP92_014044 [Vanilla planifolia]